MDKEEHKARHVVLHEEFDELMADYIRHNGNALPSKTSLMDLAKWSHEQTSNPTEEK